MKEFVNNTKDKGFFKAFIPLIDQSGQNIIIEKEVGGIKRKYLQGTASNTQVDKEDERVTKNFIRKMKDGALGLTVFSEHEHHLDKTIGYVEEVGGDEDNFVVTTALEPEYDPEKNPTGNEIVTKVLKKLNHGIKLGYSIGGRVTKVRKVYDEDVKKDIVELDDGDIFEVTVTAMPAGKDTFVNPIIKSMKEVIQDAEEKEGEDKDKIKDEKELEKALEEMVEAEKLNEQLWDFFWAFKDAMYSIIKDDQIDAAQKKTKILSVAGEFADKIEELSGNIANLVSRIEQEISAT